MSRLLTLALLASLLPACAAIQPAGAREARTDAASLLSATAVLSPAIADNWWTTLGDPQLDALIQRALADSPDLHAAQSRLRAAQAQARLVQARAGVSISGNGSIAGQHFPEHGSRPPPLAGNDFAEGRLTADLSWDLDLWGRQSALLAAAANAAQARLFDAAAIRLALSAAMADAYLRLDRAFRERDLAQTTLKLREAVLELTGKRIDAGLDTRAELLQVQTGLPQARLEYEQAELAIELIEHQLLALAGGSGEREAQVTRPDLHPRADFQLPRQVPVDLLARRPELAAARFRAEAAGALEDAARAEFYPDINLTAFIGLNALRLPDLLELGSRTAGVTPAIHLPLFDGGARQAGLDQRRAERDAAVADYNQALLVAIQQSADAIASAQSLERQLDLQAQALDSAEQAWQLSEKRFRQGLSSYLAVLTAEDALQTQRRQQIVLQTARQQALVAVQRALGGGYNRATPTATTAVSGP